ncbi:MAG: alpha/beta fold hydrolase [Desulfuromonadales bacterium]|jgi:esterase/lipase superfamily enzyme|nr:alpha/beta fold hydrolase [Desulfuromonadales bacterium]
MGDAKRKTPDTMPSAAATKKAGQRLAKPYLVSGSRGKTASKNRKPLFEVHSVFDLVETDLAQCANKHVVVFVHGYNVTRSEALRSAADFYEKLQASLHRDGQNLDNYEFILFTWPGDVGAVWFNDAQEYAQHSGVALYELFLELRKSAGASKVSLFTHSLGAHVGLRSAAILAERLVRGKTDLRYDNILLLAPAVENDVFRRPHMFDDYHFPEAPFATKKLHIFASRGDDVLRKAFSASERDAALGYAGPETMKPLKTMTLRVPEVLGTNNTFEVNLHDFSPRSTTIINPELHAHSHSDYWGRQAQSDYYINLFG